jgi:diguanylate cyclase (GGDEF)-like protein/PAS domain S-box-containing protein
MESSRLSADKFLKQFLTLVLLAWVFPPGVGMLFIAFVDIFTIDEVRGILFSRPMTELVFGSFIFAGIYFHRFAQPVVRFLRAPSVSTQQPALKRASTFPLHFWGLLTLTLILAPNLVMVEAIEMYGYQPQPIDWFRLHLVALIVTILVGLPLFFLIIDLFGKTFRGVFQGKAHITIRMKVFLIGSMVPLLIDTVLVQYYWARTGYFGVETFIVWLLLEVIAIAGSLLFVRSFGQALSPLESLLHQDVEPQHLDLDRLTSSSTDELGVLTNEYRRLLVQQKEMETKVRRSEQDLSGILHDMQDIFYRTDRNGIILFITGAVEQCVGYTPDELIGTQLATYYTKPEKRQRFLEKMTDNGGVVRNDIINLRAKDNSMVWVSTNAHFYYDSDGEIAGVEGNTRDVTQLILAEKALEKETQRALVTLASIGDGVVTTDIDGGIEYLNPVAERLLDCKLDEVRGTHYMTVLKLFNESTGEELHDLVELILHRDSAMVHADDGILTHSDGSQFTINITAAPMRSRYDEIVGVVLVLHDITEVMTMARQLSYQASHDMLTGLVNRREFERQLEVAIQNARKNDVHHVLCYMDLDQFKLVNDTSGHRAGDELLRQLSHMLKEAIREHDVLARLGGDEFGLLLMDCPLRKAKTIADSLRQHVRDFRFAWKDRCFEIGVSIGVVPITAGVGSLIDVLSLADAACYVAKEAGRNRVHVADEQDKAVARHHREMEWIHRISHAFEEDQFVLYFQPILPVNIERGEDVPRGEVLLRLHDENGEIVFPMAFIPAAERYNLMPTIDRWVVRTTLELMRDAQGDSWYPPFSCTINLSGQSLTDEYFLEYVLEQFAKSGVDTDYICFEITETAAITNLSRARRFIDTLKQHGCSFSLDDFGSGLSSFGYLKDLQVDYIKIDGSFVKDMMVDNLDHAMVESINQIGHVMGLKTIAEFVENGTIASELKMMGVDYVQGFGIAMPTPLKNVVDILESYAYPTTIPS